MDCVNHSGVNATAYCQNCGKALCATCVRGAAGGQILCEPCLVAWQNLQQPFIAPPPTGANPTAAAILGLIPGVGAMYNGQFFKALIHVVIFAVLINISEYYPIFGIFIGAWVLYQSFEAYHTAKARRDGMPLPDPLGLNEVGTWLNLGMQSQHPGQSGAPTGTGPAGPGPVAGTYQGSYTGQYQAPFTPAAGFTEPAVPPVPPVPPVYWRRKEPIGAVILIGFGLILLLNQMGILAEHFVHFLWPMIFIAIGLWLIFRRVGDSKGGAQ